MASGDGTAHGQPALVQSVDRAVSVLEILARDGDAIHPLIDISSKGINLGKEAAYMVVEFGGIDVERSDEATVKPYVNVIGPGTMVMAVGYARRPPAVGPANMSQIPIARDITVHVAYPINQGSMS